MPNILITGSNRGIGLELVRQYAQADWRVYATCRHPAEAHELHGLAKENGQISIHRLDVTVAEDIKAIGWALEDVPLDILYNNAGVYLEDDYLKPAPGTIRYDLWLRTLEVNSLGAVRVSEALLDNVAASDMRLITVMTSHMGSIEDISIPGSYYYRSSKAALNAAMRGFAEALRERGIGVLLLHPGGVQTRMGPSDGIRPAESVRGLRQVIDAFTPDQTGLFFRYDGEPMPW
ncbi:short-chain dehydrogenase [Candidatus Tenderia electrophaga]|jgi:NAD(P)-dependent dehydrogenase (short-subunit alcohol dehydrogenase family)|uniref:Short-chain dehydrogenase n=1 Tax=Candidatus Tenderia electrophaga TaxID=1748243 RepID=A0A0S2TFI3_9GAMM|nr:short-chain dehydrogenase [Candidatus Tenderia electrophaga]